MKSLENNKVQLGQSDLSVNPVGLGTMTFGQQVPESLAHSIMDRAFERGIHFFDTAEMYPFPVVEQKFTLTETIVGNWIKQNPHKRSQIVLATKVTGPSRIHTPWMRNGRTDLTVQDIEDAIHSSLKRLNTDVIDLYQIHWPVRSVPKFGELYFAPNSDHANTISIHQQLETLARFVKQGKIRHIGLSNETPYGVHEFVRLAEQHGLPRIVSTQNVYCLVNRSVENDLDESLHRLGVSLLAYSPLAFGLLTGKYDLTGPAGPTSPPNGRVSIYEGVRRQRWGRDSVFQTAKLYNDLAKQHGLTPTQLALAFCYTKWQVASTIIGVTSIEQLDQDIDVYGTVLDKSILNTIDQIRDQHRDPAY